MAIPNKRLVVLNQVSRHLANGMQFNGLADRSVHLISEHLEYPVVEIWVSNGGRQLSLLCHAYQKEPNCPEGSAQTADEGLFVEAHRTGKTIQVAKTADDSRHIERFSGTQSALSIPILIRDSSQGVLHLEGRQAKAFPRGDILAMETITAMLSRAVQSLQLFEQAQRSEEYLQAVLKASQDLAIISTDSQGYIITCSEGVERIFGEYPLQLRGRDILTLYTDELLIRGIHNLLNGKSTQDIFKKDVTEFKRGERHLFLNFQFHKVRNLRSNVIGFLGITRDITDTVNMEKKLVEMSITDDLTGLFNQREFFKQLEREIEKFKRSRRPISLCFLDLDKFKQYNDSLGHLQGDMVLREVAKFLKNNIRQHLDLAFRYGGDEFTMIMVEVRPEKAIVVAERIRRAVENYFKGAITLSIGIAPYDLRLNLRQFIQSADIAMYKAKTSGGNRVVVG